MALSRVTLPEVVQAMRHGRPWLPEATDYWLWRECFGDSSFLATAEGKPAGGVLACLSQSRPEELYIDQVAVDPALRGGGASLGIRKDFKGPGKDREIFEKPL